MKGDVKKHIALIIGTRPNLMKAAALIRALEKDDNIKWTLIHTGQHYDFELHDVFFKDLSIPAPDIQLSTKSSLSEQQHPSDTLVELIRHLSALSLDAGIVFGDVNATLWGAIALHILQIPIIHYESGLRSFDLSMPEEKNRRAADALADLLLVSMPSAMEQLLIEGYTSERLNYCGNLMIDNLIHCLPHVRRPTELDNPLFFSGKFALLTLHRPVNTSNPAKLKTMLEAISKKTEGLISLLMVLHPRTRKQIEISKPGLGTHCTISPGLGYLSFLYCLQHATLVITDSGGISEETTYLNTPCLTIRDTTERPETITLGTNQLISSSLDGFEMYLTKALTGKWKQTSPVPYWDEKAGERVVSAIHTFLSKPS